jgi:TonB family protein
MKEKSKHMALKRTCVIPWVTAFLIAATTPAISQQAQLPQPSQQSIGEQAVKVVLDHYRIDSDNIVQQTGAPLSPQGKWAISTNVPDSCPKTTYPCVRVLYTVLGTDISCEWTVLLRGSAADDVILDVNEDAAHYLTGKTASANSNQRSLRQPAPEYPIRARENRIQGTVKMLTHIAADGHVDKVVVISGPDVLRSAAVDALKKWIYFPLKIDSIAVAVQTVVEIHFRIG